VLRVAIEGNVTDVAPFFIFPSTLDLGPVRAGSVAGAKVYATGWTSALKILPGPMVLSSAMRGIVAVRSAAKPGPDSDLAVALHIKIPTNAKLGRFASRVEFKFKGYSPVVLTVVGRVVPAGRTFLSVNHVPGVRG
jgi:hypothetical protein